MSNELSTRVLEMCRARNWSLHWTCRGAYLHLESSELIEAIRGKHGDPLSEAADVLIVLMSITENAGIPWDSVVAKAGDTVERLRRSPRYHGEEYETTENPTHRLSISALHLSSRVQNILERSGIESVGHLIRQSRDNLLELNGCGETTINEIERQLESCGLYLAPNPAQKMAECLKPNVPFVGLTGDKNAEAR